MYPGANPYWSATTCCKPPIGSPPRSIPGIALAAARENCSGDTLTRPASAMACCGPATKAWAAALSVNRLRMYSIIEFMVIPPSRSSGSVSPG